MALRTHSGQTQQRQRNFEEAVQEGGAKTERTPQELPADLPAAADNLPKAPHPATNKLSKFGIAEQLSRSSRRYQQSDQDANQGPRRTAWSPEET
jgi:hypothetical protein